MDFLKKLFGKKQPATSTRRTMKFESYSEAVDMLVAIYDKTPRGEGFLTTDSSEQARLVRQIGDVLDGMGGMDEMLEAHAQFKMLRPRAARNLEMMWDGVGGWRG